MISCCDSRADPGMLMGAGPGDIFVVRNVANLVPPYRNGAEMPGIRADIEFAVKSLNVEQIIILGHSGCGGIRALMDGEGTTQHEYEFIGTWVSIARPARERVLRELAGESAGGADARVRARGDRAVAGKPDVVSVDPRAGGGGHAGAAWVVLRHRRRRVAGVLAGDVELRAAGAEAGRAAADGDAARS